MLPWATNGRAMIFEESKLAIRAKNPSYNETVQARTSHIASEQGPSCWTIYKLVFSIMGKPTHVSKNVCSGRDIGMCWCLLRMVTDFDAACCLLCPYDIYGWITYQEYQWGAYILFVRRDQVVLEVLFLIYFGSRIQKNFVTFPMFGSAEKPRSCIRSSWMTEIRNPFT